MRAGVGIKTERIQYSLYVPLLFVAALIGYKWNAAGIAIQKVRSTGVMLARADVVAFGGYTAQAALERTLHYFLVIWPALVFGILIGAAVRAFVPSDWFSRRLSGDKMGTQILSGMAGAPLMLCSCCVVSVFSAVYERSSRLAPSIAIMLGSPALNPAALVLTFLLFAPKIALARLLMAAPAVFLSGLIIEGLFGNRAAGFVLKTEYVPLSFSRALMDVVIRTVPLLLIGVIASMLLIEYLPPDLFASNSFRSLAVIATASIAVPLALPTFFEIPLALGLIAAGAPAGAAAALLFAGPIINLPSLFAVAKLTNWRIAATLAGVIWAVAVFGGFILNQIPV